MRVRTLVIAVALVTGLVISPSAARARPPTWSSPIWSVTLDGGPLGLAADADGAVVTTDSGAVRAFDAKGVTQWETTVEDMSEDVSDPEPAISHDLVLVGTTGRVVALARRDGAIRWQQPIEGPMEDMVTSVALGGSFALVGDRQGTLHAFDASSGTPVWSVAHEGQLWSAPRVDADLSIVVAVWYHPPGSVARAFDLASGAPRWEQAVGLLTATPVLDRGRVFLATGNGHHNAWVAEFDVANGASDWTVISPASFQSDVVPAVDARDLVVADQMGQVSAIDPVSGTPRWTRPLKRPVFSTHIALLERRVALITLSGELYVLDRVSGRVVARGDMRAFGGLPAVAVPFGSRNQVLVGLRLTDPGRVELRRVP
jgi:outer membrane protein assembly factor BamB